MQGLFYFNKKIGQVKCILHTAFTLNIEIDRPKKIVHNQIRLLLKEQSDHGSHFLLIYYRLLYTLFKLKDKYNEKIICPYQ